MYLRLRCTDFIYCKSHGPSRTRTAPVDVYTHGSAFPNMIKLKVVSSVPEPDPDPWIRKFLELLDPDPDLLVRGTDPDPSIIKQKY